MFRVELDFLRQKVHKLRLGEMLTEFWLHDLKIIMKARKVMFYGLVNINYMIMGHKNAHLSLAGSKAASSWLLRTSKILT